MKKKLVSFGLLAMIIVMLGTALTGCDLPSQGPSVTPTPSNLPPVKAAALVTAEASIVPVQKATLSFLTGGQIIEILVAEGKPVKAGETIIRLKGADRLQASIAATELELATAQRALNDINKNTETQRAQWQLRLATAEKKLDKAKSDLAAKKSIIGSQGQIDEARANYLLANDGLKAIEEKYNMYLSGPEDDLTRALALAEIGRSRTLRDRALNNLNYLLKRPDSFEVNLAEGDVKVAEADVNLAKLELAKLKDGPNPDDVLLAKARIKNAEAQLKAAQTALTDLILVSPIDGIVVANGFSVGETVAAGLGNVVVANLSDWQVETTDLTELDVVKFKEGDPVVITVDALPGVELAGKVKRVKAQGVNKQGDITYTVIITLDSRDDRLRWNMTASVSFQKPSN